MKVCTCELIGVSPLEFSKPVVSVKDKSESHDVFEARTWRERVHVDSDGNAFIPAAAFKMCLESVGSYLQETIKGKGKSTYTKLFRAGILIPDDLSLGVKADTAEGLPLYVPADGKKGGTTRVWRTFPIFRQWSCTATIILLDRILQDAPEKVREYAVCAGQFIGLGSYAPRRGGTFGRFKVGEWHVENYVAE